MSSWISSQMYIFFTEKKKEKQEDYLATLSYIVPEFGGEITRNIDTMDCYNPVHAPMYIAQWPEVPNEIIYFLLR